MAVLSWECGDHRPFILISDIDDTLKRTHRLSRTGMLKKGMRSRNAFAGMSELYLSWATQGLLDSSTRELAQRRRAMIHNPRRLVSYVTGAIGKFQWFSCLFLVRSDFPVGLYLGRDRGSSFDFKISAIKGLLEDFPDHTPIFVGDNGEHDPQVFEFFQRHLKAEGREAHFFVHKVYEKSIGDQQIPFVSALDLGIHFFNHHWIDEASLGRVAASIATAFHRNEKQVLPRWVVCSDISEFWPGLERDVEYDLKKRVEAIRRLLVRKLSKKMTTKSFSFF